jgi:hypothetical protein
MLNFNAPLHIQRERLATCKKCKFYQPTFGTCGTPLIGGTVEPEENNVTYYKEKIKLCGCFMDVKTKFRFTSCPANKWFAIDMKPEDIAALDVFIQRVSKANKIEQEDLHQLYTWYGKITKRTERPSGCASCIRDLIKEFRRQLGKVNEAQ